MKLSKTLYLMLLLSISIILVACTEKEGASKQDKQVAETVKTFLLYSETSTSGEYGSTGDLYIKTFTNESEKIASNVLDGKYEYVQSNDSVLFLTGDHDLYRYEKGSDKEKLASNVSHFSGSLSDQYIFYQNDNDDLYIIDESNESEKIASSVYQIDMVDSDLYYSNYDGNLKMYNIQSRLEKSIASNVTYFKLLNKNGDLIYTNDDFMLFYKKADEDAVRISSKEVNSYFTTQVDDGFVYIAYEDEDQILYKTSLDGTETKKIANDVISFNMSNNDIVYLTFDDNLFLNIAEENTALKLASDVIDYYIVEDNIYFQDTNSKVFKVSKDGKKTELASNVGYLKITNDGTLIYENDKSELFVGDKKVATDLDGFSLFGNNIAYATANDQLHFIENLGESIIIEEDLSKYSVVTYQNEVIFSNYLTFNDISGVWKAGIDGEYGYITISNDGLITNRYTNSTTPIELIFASYNSMVVMLDGIYATIELSENSLIMSDEYETLYFERASLEDFAEVHQVSEDANVSNNKSGGITSTIATLDTVPYPGSVNTVETAREQISYLLYAYLVQYTSFDTYNLDTTVYYETDFYNQQVAYMDSLFDRGIMLDLIDYTIVDMKQLSETKFTAITREDYIIYYADDSYKDVTQTATYTIELINGEFYITNLIIN